MTVETKINTLKSLLPESPFVQEQIGYALKYAQEAENFEANLGVAVRIADYANRFYKPGFFKYRPILCALLQDVPEDKLAFFVTETNPILVPLAEFTNFKAQFNTSAKNCANTLALTAQDKKEILITLLCWLIQLVEEGNKEDITKIAYMFINLRLNDINLTEENYDAYNKLFIAINKADF